MEFVVVVFRLKGVKSGDEVQFFFSQCFQQHCDNCWSYSFFHFKPSTILHLYPRYRVKRPCDGSVFQLRFAFVYGTGLNVPVLDSKHIHFQLNQFQVSINKLKHQPNFFRSITPISTGYQQTHRSPQYQLSPLNLFSFAGHEGILD